VRTACISFKDRNGGLYGHMTQAKTLFKAVAAALDGPGQRAIWFLRLDFIPEGRWWVRGERCRTVVESPYSSRR
jgi:hypothetical protein